MSIRTQYLSKSFTAIDIQNLRKFPKVKGDKDWFILFEGVTDDHEFMALDTIGAITHDKNATLQIFVNSSPYFRHGGVRFGVPIDLKSPLYILPSGQKYFICIDKKVMCDVHIRYVMYDGSDAVLAIQLLEMGYEVSPDSIDELHRNLVDDENGKRLQLIYALDEIKEALNRIEAKMKTPTPTPRKKRVGGRR